MLPYVLKFNATSQKAASDYATLAPYVFPKINLQQGTQAICSDFIDGIKNLSSQLGLPQRLREVDIPENACKKMAHEAMKQTRLLVNNPREVKEEDAFNIYKSAW